MCYDVLYVYIFSMLDLAISDGMLCYAMQFKVFNSLRGLYNMFLCDLSVYGLWRMLQLVEISLTMKSPYPP